MMSIRESFEQRGEIRDIAIGEIKLLLEFGKIDTEIIRYLMTDEENPLTRQQVKYALKIITRRKSYKNEQ